MRRLRVLIWMVPIILVALSAYAKDKPEERIEVVRGSDKKLYAVTYRDNVKVLATYVEEKEPDVDPVRKIIEKNNPKLPAKKVANAIKEGCDGKIDPLLVTALIKAESGFNPNAKSRTGAIGLGQILPSTGKHAFGATKKDLYDPVKNAKYTARYLRMAVTSRGSVERGLRRYTGGSGGNRHIRNIMRTHKKMQQEVKKG